LRRENGAADVGCEGKGIDAPSTSQRTTVKADQGGDALTVGLHP